MEKYRTLLTEIIELSLKNKKMAFISGPRQVGKTTLSKMIGRELNKPFKYFNWDQIGFRKIWQKTPLDFLKGEGIIFDEIHKARSWKTTLKGIFDHNDSHIPIIVTGSAKLDTFRRGGDSLMGRYFHFRLHPFTLGELSHQKVPYPKDLLENIKNIQKKTNPHSQELLNQLLNFGPFPETFLKKDERFIKLWQTGRIEKLVRIDLRDLTRIMELGQVEILCSLLPDRVGSVLSIKSLSEDMESSFATIKNWLSHLISLYYIYEVKPFHKKIPRAHKKEGKIYLWDFSEVKEKGPRWENLIANHLLKAAHYWTDLGFGSFDLKLFKDKQKREVDFVLTHDDIPWAIFEVKSDGDHYSPHLDYFLSKWPSTKLAISLTKRENIYRDLGMGRYIISAANFLEHLP